MIKLSVKKPFLTFVAVIIVLVIGIVSASKMKTNLLPDISMPYMLVITTEPGASPEKVENDVTKPLESALGTISGVENVSSTSAENYGIVMLEFSDKTNMDSAMVRVSSAINQVTLPEMCGTPNIMEISMDMMATMYTTLSYEGKDIIELTDFAKEVVVPYIERQDGVASITQIGSVTQTMEVRLNGDKIDELNEEILLHTNDKLSDAKKDIDKGLEELEKAKKSLESKESDLADTQKDANSGITTALNKLDEAKATKAAYEASLASLKASKSALEGEKKAYQDNDIEGGYQKLNQMFAGFQSTLGEVAAMSGISIPTSIEDAINNPDKFNSFKQWLTTMGHGNEVASLTVESLQTMHNVVNVRIPQIDTELANLSTEIAAAEAMVKAITDKMKDIDKNYEDALSGAFESSAGFGSANAQFAAGKTSIEEATKELEEAKKTFKESKKAALDNANLDALISLDALSGIIYAQNFEMPAGYIDDKDDNQWLLKVGEEYKSKEDIESMVLCKVDGVGVIKLSDVADITIVDNSDMTYAKHNTEDAILLSIYKSSTANTSEVSENCKEAFEFLENKYDGLEIVPFSDQATYITMFLDSILSSILVGAILAILVLILFLKSVKPTFVVAFSIPFSVLFAIVIMYFTGIDLNIMSLAGLALAIGMLVDNSIVVIENIYRLRSKGIAPARAAVQGTKQVAAPIIASTITTICVFLPMVFTSGMIQDIIVPFSLTISYALVASLLVALTVAPTFGSVILTKTKEIKYPLFEKIQNVYGKTLAWCLRFKIVPILVSVVLLVFCIVKVFQMGIVMIPNMSSDTITVMATMPEDTENDEARKLADEVLENIVSVEGVAHVGAMDNTSTANMFVGGVAGTESEAEFSGFIYYVIPDEDVDTIEEMDNVIDSIKTSTEGIACEVSVGAEESSSQMLASGISVNIYGDEEETLLDISEDVVEILESVDGIKEASNGIEDADQTIHLAIDKDKVAKKGLTVAQIYNTITEEMKTEKSAATINVDNTDVEIELIDETDVLSYENLLDLELEATKMNSEGKQETKTYKLGDFAEIELVKSASVISRENQTRYLTVTSETEEGGNAALIARDLKPLIDEYDAPEGYDVVISGESEEVEEMLEQMLLAIALGLLLIYLVMVAQFQSLLSPFIVLFTIPLAFTGGLIGLLIFNEQISAMSLLGFMVLMGTVVNNGIVFVDYVNQLRIQGLDKKNALIATGKIRMRPILMTALTTILAMSQMLFSKDISATMSRGMAVVIAFGLIYATLMTLYIVPIMYDILFRKQPKVIDVGDDLDDIPDEAAEYMSNL